MGKVLHHVAEVWACTTKTTRSCKAGEEELKVIMKVSETKIQSLARKLEALLNRASVIAGVASLSRPWLANAW